MRPLYAFTWVSVIIISLFAFGCDDRNAVEKYLEAAAAAEQHDVVFHGRVFYEDGSPAADAVVLIRLDTRDPSRRGIDQFVSRALRLRTDQSGRFNVHAQGSALRIEEIRGQGKWLYEGYPFMTSKKQIGNRGYDFGSTPSVRYVASDESPAIFVLVRDGHQGVKVWPSRGGKDCFVDGTCITNLPEKPREPSVDYEAMAAVPVK